MLSNKALGSPFKHILDLAWPPVYFSLFLNISADPTVSQSFISCSQGRSSEVPEHEERKAQEEAESSTKLSNEGEGVIDHLLGLLDDLVVGVDQEESHTVGRDGDHLADHLVLVELAGRQTLDKRVESQYSQDS